MRVQAKLVLILLLLLMAQVPFVYCDIYYGNDHNIYPAHTPRTYIPRQANYNTQFIVDIDPKYWMVKPEPIDLHVRLQVDILDDDKVSRIVIAVWVPDPVSSDFDSGNVFVWDSEGNPVGKMVKNYYTSFGEGDMGWWYHGVVERNEYFTKGEYFYIEFTEHIVPTPWGYITTDLLMTKYSASGNMEKEGVDTIYIRIEKGQEYSTIPPNPMFATPEYPLGTITSLIMMFGALTFWKRYVHVVK